MRKFRRLTKPAVFGLELTCDFFARSGQNVSRHLHTGRRYAGRKAAEGIAHRGILLFDFFAVILKVARHAPTQVGEGRHAVTRFLRKIGAAEERRLVVWHQKQGERPAARTLRQHLVGSLVDAVEIGALLAVNLDVHEQLVHHPGGVLVLE